MYVVVVSNKLGQHFDPCRLGHEFLMEVLTYFLFLLQEKKSEIYYLLNNNSYRRLFIVYFHHIVAIIACMCFIEKRVAYLWFTFWHWQMAVGDHPQNHRKNVGAKRLHLLYPLQHQRVQEQDTGSVMDRGTSYNKGMRTPYTIIMYTKLLSGFWMCRIFWSHLNKYNWSTMIVMFW